MGNKYFNEEIGEIASELTVEYWATYVDIQMYITSTNIPHKDQIKIVQDSALILNEAMEKGNSVKSVIGDSTAEYCERVIKEIRQSLSHKERLELILEKLLFIVSSIFSFFSLLLIIDIVFKKGIILRKDGNAKVEVSQILSLIMVATFVTIITRRLNRLKKSTFVKKTIIWLFYIVGGFIISLIIFSIFDAIAPEYLYLNAYLLLILTGIMITVTYTFSKYVNK